MEFVLDVVIDALKDTAELIPFLFATYVVISLLDLFASDKTTAAIQRAGHAGPLIGGVLGVVPQCGFSAMGASLYADRIVSLGTFVAVILSTSDEMLPLLLAEHVEVGLLARILVTKAVLGVILGFAIDLVLRVVLGRTSLAGVDESDAGEEQDEDAEFDPSAYSCDCGCGEPLTRGQTAWWVVVNSAYRTFQVVVFIFVVSVLLNALIALVGEDALASFLSGNAVVATLVSGFVGLVPNCAASVVLTQLYIDGVLGFAPMIAGTLVAGGAGYLVLFRMNGNMRENAAIVGIVYALGVCAGLVMLGLGL
ncbi:putative manganese transporter [uncultured Parolsenella sp.]|uniref:putative manganese transporter n=1 Tax=uncultured Parolsenella sp. TaxID=2083008 RepID=UPI002592B71D|nr:putative manganese transporter [uncultured Parolsenella sp.]